MVRKGEILSQAVSEVGDELLEGARELFYKSEEEISQAQELYEKQRQSVRKKMIYVMSAVAAACILVVLGAGITLLSVRQGIPKVYYDGVLLDENGTLTDDRLDTEPAVVSYSLERSSLKEKSEFTLHIKARGSFTIEASSGGFGENGENVIAADGEADIVWMVEPCEGAFLTVRAGAHSVKVELQLDDGTGQWMLKTAEGEK